MRDGRFAPPRLERRRGRRQRRQKSIMGMRMASKLGRPVVSTSANLSGEPSPRKYADIVPAIREAVDYTVDPRLEAGATGKASQIIRVGMDGEVEILRA